MRDNRSFTLQTDGYENIRITIEEDDAFDYARETNNSFFVGWNGRRVVRGIVSSKKKAEELWKEIREQRNAECFQNGADKGFHVLENFVIYYGTIREIPDTGACLVLISTEGDNMLKYVLNKITMEEEPPEIANYAKNGGR